MELLIGSVLFAFTVSFLCSVMEAALLSLTPGQMAELKQRRPREGAIWERFKDDIEKPISVILFLNTAAHTIGATVAGSQFAIVVGQRWVAVFSIVFTYLMLQFTEILPKALGVRFNAAVAPIMAVPLAVLVKVLRPLIYLINLINRPFEKKDGEVDTTLQEISALAGTARLDNLIGHHQERIIRGSTRLSGMKAKDVMVPADQITFLSASHRLVDAIVAAHQDPHTRFPVMETDDRNKVLGYVNFKELVYRVRTNPADPTLRGIIRPITIFAPSTPANQIIKTFVDEHNHIAIVQDPQTKTILGLVTLEDLVEELVGEIEDEFDRLPRMCQALNAGVWIVGGGLPASEMFTRVGLPPEPTRDVTSRWLINRVGKLPKLGQVIPVGEKDITVRRMRRGKVFEVLVTPHGMAPREFM